MSVITEPADYRGVVIEHAVGKTKETDEHDGLPQFVAKLRALERYDPEEKVWFDWSNNEDNEITAYLVLFDKNKEPIFHAKDVQKVFEWDGQDLIVLKNLDLEGAEVQFKVAENTFKNKTSLQVANIRGYNEEPGGSIKKLDDDELAKLNAQFGNSLKKLSGGPKAAKAGKTTTATATTTAAKRGRPKKTTAAPKPPTAPTEEAATAEAGTGTDLPVEEAIEEFKDGKATAAPAAPKAPPAPPTAAKEPAASATDAETMTYEEAWKACYDKKAKTVDDKMIAAAFSAAMHRQAPGKSETEITGEEWALITEAVIGECG